jgi:hypothetical protein
MKQITQKLEEKMSFIKNAEATAAEAIRHINPSLENQFITIVRFLFEFPEYAAKLKGKNSPDIGATEYIIKLAKIFADGRLPQTPRPPHTIPDELVSIILHQYFDLPESQLEQIKQEHQLSMGAENLVGGVLERYLASVLEPHGWVWCSGSVVRAIDFIKPPSYLDSDWNLLQVKNRDNSENSSSSAIRNGTNIHKWFRTFSKKPGTNWVNFPDQTIRSQLSEQAFKQFSIEYLQELKGNKKY